MKVGGESEHGSSIGNDTAGRGRGGHAGGEGMSESARVDDLPVCQRHAVNERAVIEDRPVAFRQIRSCFRCLGASNGYLYDGRNEPVAPACERCAAWAIRRVAAAESQGEPWGWFG